jgi:hypothetical protein
VDDRQVLRHSAMMGPICPADEIPDRRPDIMPPLTGKFSINTQHLIFRIPT